MTTLKSFKKAQPGDLVKKNYMTNIQIDNVYIDNANDVYGVTLVDGTDIAFNLDDDEFKAIRDDDVFFMSNSKK